MESFNFNTNIRENPEINKVENLISESLPTQELLDIFGEDTYLIGGAVRDFLFSKKPSDFDLMSRQTLGKVLARLQSLGYEESENEKFKPRKYSVKIDKRSSNLTLRNGVVNLFMNGKEFQVGLIGDNSIEDLVREGDINLSCCAFSLAEKKIINPETAEEIIRREIKFTNPEQSKTDPEKILNALKAISRFPELKIARLTREIIEDSVPLFIKFFSENEKKRLKLSQLFGNINSAEVISFFNGYDTDLIFNGFERHKSKLTVTEPYISKNISELDEETKIKIADFIKQRFGKRFDQSKLFNNKINSVVYELNESQQVITCCCLIDSERLYATASEAPENIIKLVENLCRNNYNIWTTISINSKLLISMSEKAGLKSVENVELLKKILTNQYPEYEGLIEVKQLLGYTVFTKIGSDDSPQVLMKS